MRSLISFFSTQVTSFMHIVGINVLDVIIFIVIFFYAYEGYILGVVTSGFDLLSFILSFIIALKVYNGFGLFLGDNFGIPPGIARAIAFFIAALISEIVLTFLFRKLEKKIPDLSLHPSTLIKRLNHILGIIPGLASAFIILSFLFSIIVSLPSSPFLKKIVITSKIGKTMVANTSLFEKRLNDIFGGALNETMNFLTVKPKSNERINLRFTVQNPTIDPQSEEEMLRLVNKARKENGVPPLRMDTALRALAREYSRNMLQKGFFSHYDEEGKSPFDRMDEHNIQRRYAGENLAFAPSTELAMQGLLNSPGHRANILNPNFTKIGVGVLDGGVYGKMFTQEFTD